MPDHFSFHRFLERTAEQVFQRLLNIMRRLDVILAQQLTNDLRFPSVIIIVGGFSFLPINKTAHVYSITVWLFTDFFTLAQKYSDEAY